MNHNTSYYCCVSIPFEQNRRENNWNQTLQLYTQFSREKGYNNYIHCARARPLGRRVMLTVCYYLCVNFNEVLLYSAKDKAFAVFSTKFSRSTRQILPKKWTAIIKNSFVSRGLGTALLKILCTALLSICTGNLASTRPSYLR